MARLTVRLDQPLGTIDPNVYGLRNLEMRTDSPRIWVGAGSPIRNTDGIRMDTVEALRRIAPGFISGPGAEWYRWQDGIGPREKRPVRVSYWGRSAFEAVSMEWRNDFGTDEFVRFCRLVGSEPLLLCNEEDPVGSRDWVEYCNYEGDSYYAQLRKDHGHPEPYNVKYWNMYGWMDMEPEEYAASYRRFAAPVRALDPSVKLIAEGTAGEWNQRVFDKLNRAMVRNFGGTDLIDYLAQIFYTGQNLPDVDYSDAQYYRVLHNCAGVDGVIRDLDTFLRDYDKERRPWGIEWLKMPDIGTKTIQLAPLEWGTVHFMERQTMREAVAHAALLDTFHRWAARVSMASPFLNMLIESHGDRILLTPTYHLFDLYRPHQGNQAVSVEVDCDQLRGEDVVRAEDLMGSGGAAAGFPMTKLPPLLVLSSSASVNASGKEIVVSMSNRHLTDEVEVKVTISGRGNPKYVEMRVLTSPHVRDFNDLANPDCIGPRTLDVQWKEDELTVVLEPFSVNVLKAGF